MIPMSMYTSTPCQGPQRSIIRFPGRRNHQSRHKPIGLSFSTTKEDGEDEDIESLKEDNTLKGVQKSGVTGRATNSISTSSYADDDDDDDDDPFSYESDSDNANGMNGELNEEEFLQRELKRLEKLEEILAELEEFATLDNDDDEDNAYQYNYDLDQGEEDDFVALDQDVLLKELLESFPDEDGDEGEAQRDVDYLGQDVSSKDGVETESSSLEAALLQGVVPADAGVGSGQLPGDYGFDPLQVSTRDYIQAGQELVSNFLLPFSSKLASSSSSSSQPQEPQKRPNALILRDYREAEIRHGRLAMLAALIWPLQEMVDQFLLAPDQFGSLLFGKVTLPYFPLFMTAVMLLLGYLDIYSAAIKDMDQIGEAFLPGDCFWDPLSVLEGAPPRMKRNMQERELFNGRMAMLAFAMFVWEETATQKALISIPANELLFKPLYQVSFIQEYLDAQFSHQSVSLDYLPDGG